MRQCFILLPSTIVLSSGKTSNLGTIGERSHVGPLFQEQGNSDQDLVEVVSQCLAV